MSLGIPERQILAHCPADAITRRRRALMRQLEGSRRIWPTPDSSARAVDLADRNAVAGVIPLQRNAPFPPRLLVYAFDNPIDAQVLARIRAEGRAMAELLGGAQAAVGGQAVAPDGAIFIYADPSCSFFGEDVDDNLLGSEETAVARGSVCLVKRGDEWTTAERSRPATRCAGCRRSSAERVGTRGRSRSAWTRTRTRGGPRFARR